MARQLFVDPQANQAIDLIRAQGESRAAALAKIADANARATEIGGNAQANAQQQSGQAWSGAANQIGQTIGAIPGQIEQAKMRGLQQQMLQGQVDEQKRAVEARNQFLKIIQDTPQTDEDGVSLYNVPDVAKQLAAVGQDPAIAVEHLGKINDAFRQERAAKMSLVKTGAASIAAAGNDPVLADHFLTQLEKNGTYPKDQIAQFRDFIKADPGNTEKLTAYLMGPQKGEVVPAGASVVNPVTSKVTFTAPPKAPNPSFEAKAVLLDGEPQEVTFDKNSGKYIFNGEDVTGRVQPAKASANAQSESFMLDGKPVKGAFVPDASGGKYLYNGQDVTARVKPIPAASTIIQGQRDAALSNLPTWATDSSRPVGPDANKIDPAVRMTPNGLFQAAQSFIATGQFPPTGRGADPTSLAVRSAINAKVGAIAAESGMDLPELRAFYKANQASLTANVKMQDAVQGFMATADKNADLLQKTLDKIPDLGSPALNKPLRSLDKNLLGDPNMSKFATYLQSVQNEYGRIISQPNLAGQLTDSARHEAEALIDPKATVPQIIASIQALKAEGDNRLLSVGEQVKRIQQRMQVGPGASSGSEPKPVVWERGPDGKPRKAGG
jgi:hypothetical protein